MTDHDYLQPRVLARIRDLPLRARVSAQGLMLGLHHSRQPGVGLEFSQFRDYQPGDDPRRIDWKFFARSDRYFVREAQRESQSEIWFVVDCSASMAQASAAVQDWSKLDYARSVVACLAYLAERQGDAFGLSGLSEAGLTYLPARRGRSQLDALLLALQRLRARAGWPARHQMQTLWERIPPRGLVCVISDFFEADEEIAQLVSQLGAAGKELMTLQVLTDEELTFPFRGALSFRDPETGQKRRVDAGACREKYLARFNADREALARRLRALGADHSSVSIEQPLDTVLRRLLMRRR